VGMSNNILYHQTVWDFNERFGPRINPSDNVEINPFIGYELTRTFSTARNSNTAIRSSKQLGLNGRVYLFKTNQVHFNSPKQINNKEINGLKS
jgi:hypothetical protein